MTHALFDEVFEALEGRHGHQVAIDKRDSALCEPPPVTKRDARRSLPHHLDARGWQRRYEVTLKRFGGDDQLAADLILGLWWVAYHRAHPVDTVNCAHCAKPGDLIKLPSGEPLHLDCTVPYALKVWMPKSYENLCRLGITIKQHSLVSEV